MQVSSTNSYWPTGRQALEQKSLKFSQQRDLEECCLLTSGHAVLGKKPRGFWQFSRHYFFGMLNILLFQVRNCSQHHKMRIRGQLQLRKGKRKRPDVGARRETSWKQKTTGAGCSVEDGRMQLLLSSSIFLTSMPLSMVARWQATHTPGEPPPDKDRPTPPCCKVNILLNLSWCRTEGQQRLECSLTKMPQGLSHTVLIQLVQKLLKKF